MACMSLAHRPHSGSSFGKPQRSRLLPWKGRHQGPRSPALSAYRTLYTVRPGDTLWKIAARFSTTWPSCAS
ncbi:MAG: LysM peptidoglycan-binding domain-containing protein [Deltaproteobacteria bacterium]|nr:MAG: LysM peptidoglycan-binding domain-containing protein [Deltaproteobacteria bacterium]